MNNMLQISQVIANIGILTFVVASMVALGLSLSVGQIVQPLRNGRLVVMTLLANFVLTPALAFALKAVIPMDESYAIGLILLATAAGAPFLPKLVQVAKGSAAISVGIMVLLMVTTIIYVPLVLPLLLPGVAVNPLDIAQSLVVLMLIPLAVGLFIKSRYSTVAESLQPPLAQISNVGLMLGFVALLALSWRSLLSTIGSGAILATALLIIGSFLIGWFLVSKEATLRPVFGLGTAQRNIAAALVVAGGNFDDPKVLVMCMVGSLLMLVILMITAAELGKRVPLTTIYRSNQ